MKDELLGLAQVGVACDRGVMEGVQGLGCSGTGDWVFQGSSG